MEKRRLAFRNIREQRKLRIKQEIHDASQNPMPWIPLRDYLVQKIGDLIREEIGSGQSQTEGFKVYKTRLSPREGGRRGMAENKSTRSTKSPREHKTMGSMAEEPTSGTEGKQQEEEVVVEKEQLDAWAREANKMLDRYKLKEAEQLFHKVLVHTDDTIKERDRNVISSLVGLSEVYSKRARSMRSNELEWHRMYMHAITSKRKAMEYCNNALNEEQQEDDNRWFKTQEQRARANLKVLQDCLVRSLQDRIVENKSGLTPMEKLMGLRRRVLTDIEEQAEKAKPLVNTSWLDRFQGYVSDKFNIKDEPEEEIPDNMEDMPGLKRSQSLECLQEIKPVRKKKINFEKVQTAIQDLVKQITKDMKHRQIHKDMTPEEKLTLMSPLTSNFDLFGTFKQAMYSDDASDDIDGETEEEIQKDGASSSSSSSQELHKAEIGVSDRSPVDGNVTGGSEVLIAAANWRHSQDNLNYNILSGSSKRWQSSSQNSRISERETNAERVTTRLQQTAPRRTPSPTTTPYMPPLRRRPQVEEEDVLKNIGVLRVWRGYKTDNSPDQVLDQQSQYKLQTYEEMSPLTEVAGRSWTSRRKIDKIEEETDLSVQPGAAVSEKELNLTLAHALTSLADRLTKHDNLKESSDLYIYALGILKKNSTEDTQADLKPRIAHIMQSLGTIKCKQGDFVGGSQLMEECISIYRLLGDRKADLSMASTWFQLGSAFMAEQWKESTLYEYIMKAVKQVMEREVKEEDTEIGELEEDSDDEDENEGDAYWVSTQEAIVCFNHALNILRRLGPSNEHNQLYVESLTKLGDCSFMTGNYEHAIKCYEEALYLFKNIIGSATLSNNAHVLAMLGTTNFLCGSYSKAASMYECAHMLQQHIYGADDATFEMAFTLTMMGLTFYSMQRFHRSIAWCLKAFELYTLLYKEEITNVDKLHRWFVTESLYIVGYSYSTLSFHEKSLNYLGISKSMVKGCEDMDVKQCVKILKAIADEYASLEDNANALAYYEEALKLSQDLGNESNAAALQNQLLNRMAGVHVNTKEYSTAALYLQQALDYQKNVENTIKDDLIGILRQLGLTYTLSGDVDKAIECYNDCLDAYQETSGTHKEEKAQLMGTLGTLYHVKACIQDDNDDMENLLTRAEKFYQDALNIDSTSSVCVQYANYLYQQAQAGDALLAMLPVVHSPNNDKLSNQAIVYNGVEQAVLPEHIQQEIDEIDEVALESRVFSKFLAILCYKQLKLDKDAEDCLVDLYKAVSQTDVSLNHSILGYAMLEMNLYPEAAECFANAAGLQNDNDLAITNYWISLCLWSYGTMTSSIRNIFADALREAEDEWVLENKLREAVRRANQKPTERVRDSGYYDPPVDDVEVEYTDEAWAPMDEITYISDRLTEIDQSIDGGESRAETRKILQRMMDRRRYIDDDEDDILPMYDETITDGGYTSNECLVDTQALPPVSQRIDKWESIRNVYENENRRDSQHVESTAFKSEEYETPAVILEMLQQQQELLNREYQVHFDVGIIGEDDEETETHQPKAASNNTFANMVETPQSILHEVERKMVEEESGIYPSRAEHHESTWSSTQPASSPQYHQESTYQTTHQRKRSRSPEPDEYSSETWVTEEVVVETPVEILEALHQGQPTSTSSERKTSTASISLSSPRHVTAMEISPDTEQPPVSSPETWTMVEETVETPVAILHTLQQQQQRQYDEIDSIHNWDSQGNNITTQQSWSNSHDIPTDTQAHNNNQASSYTSSTTEETYRPGAPKMSHYEISKLNRSVGGIQARVDERVADVKRSEHFLRKTARWPEEQTTTWSDQQNGNGWTSHNTSVHSTHSDKEEEEVWETSDETVTETPPELLALLRAKQIH